MTPAISIIFPHLRQSANDKALKIALECIVDNTNIDYELMIESVETRRDIYPVWNSMAQRANSEWLLMSNTDVFFAPGWAEPIYHARDAHTIVSPIMVEPGAIGVNFAAVHGDFGMLPDSFRRREFEAWVKAEPLPPGWNENTRAWYMPSLIPRQAFLELGGFDTSEGGFPDWHCDKLFWDAWAAAGYKFKRVKSYSYHIQHWSSESEQARLMRYE